MKINIFTKTCILLVCLAATSYSQSADDDLVDITIPDYNHRIYSGYLDIQQVIHKKSIHYVFFESQGDVTKDPLVLWLSGGPACSSLLGAFQENGPLIFPATKHNLLQNKFSWNKNANVLYLELPAGVGFSTIQNQQQEVDDQILTTEAVQALRQFLARFQKMKQNQLFLTGHGYAAVYITHLAKLMIDQNNDPFSRFNDKWNLKGILVGNPCTKPNQCYATGTNKKSAYTYEFLHKRAFIPTTVYNKYLAPCAFNYDSAECFQQRQLLDKQIAATNTSAYNIYSKCYKGQNDSQSNYINTGCEDEAGIMTFLNDNATQYNWNIRPKEWTPCNTKVHDAYMSANNSYYLYPDLIKGNIRIWVYSGDLDSSVPITGTKKWINELRGDLQMPVRRNWRQWWVPGQHKGQDQVGGFIWELEHLTFVSVKGAGLRTARDQPEAMAEVLAGFLSGKTLPYKNQNLNN